MITRNQKEVMHKVLMLLVLALFLNLPVVSALEIRNIRADSITDKSAVISWETDQPADSFVSYGPSKENLQKQGDAQSITNHQLTISSLAANSSYVYSVQSNEVKDDNSGNYYTFNTLPIDIIPPVIQATIPELVQGSRIDLSGTSEVGTEVSLLVNGALSGISTVLAESAVESTEGSGAVETNDAGTAVTETSSNVALGTFQFADVILNGNANNDLTLQAKDHTGNIATVSGVTYSDNDKPVIRYDNIPELTAEHSVSINGNISENVKYEITINDKSVISAEGTTFNQLLTLDEGGNNITITATDKAGWEAVEQTQIISDTVPPSVTAEIEKGTEYYEGRAESSINGKTKPGAKVYLYAFRQLSYEYKPDFGKAWAKVDADENGEFTFKEVTFQSPPINLNDLKPKEVPQGLQDLNILQTDLANQPQQTVYVYIIVEDQTGKNAYWQNTVTVLTCSSSSFDFSVQSMSEFQAPLRLNPQLLDSGRESVAAVFNFSYRGKAVPKIDPVTGVQIEPAFMIDNPPTFDRACTQKMLEDKETNLGCNLMPRNQPGKLPNGDKSAWYITWNLNSADKLSEKKESYWNEIKKRQVMFPVKITLTYRERLGETSYQAGTPQATSTGQELATGLPTGQRIKYSQWSEPKTQTFCTDLGYMVDLPIDSKKMLPDWLADEGLQTIDGTIKKIDKIMPYLEKAILVTGIGCMSSVGLKTAARYTRVVTSKLEVWFTKKNDKEKQCPLDQSKLHLKSTVDEWSKLESKFETENRPRGENWQQNVLDDKCPKTAAMWKFESYLDLAYRGTCDRFFCRAVPAKWTSTKEKEEVDTVIQSELECTATSEGVPLQKVDNCQELIAKSVTVPSQTTADKIKDGGFVCYRFNDKLYVVNTEKVVEGKSIASVSDQGQLVPLSLVHDFGISIQEAGGYIGETNLLAYKPPNSENFIVGQDKACSAACRNPRRPGFKADTEGGASTITKLADGTFQSKQNGCYIEKKDATGKIALYGGDNKPMTGTNRYIAGYTQDCFAKLDVTGNPEIKEGETGLLRCVCTEDVAQQQIYGARTAMKEQDGTAEPWDYREAQIYTESRKSAGTYYPEWRYYSGRDFSSAFGANFLLDFARKPEQVHQINPFTQHIGAFQTACLPGIRGRLVLLRSVLQGLSGCITQAKVTGLMNAGSCKTIFAQHVCGLIYKSIAYFFQGCTPYDFGDATKGSAFEDVGAVLKAGLGSIPEVMQSSIDDLKSDYGNAKLNEFFAQGAQGVAQSMCMAAFGFDWPFNTQFIMDAAYAVPMKTTVNVMPAERELSTYNPSIGTAVFNYNVAAQILPGCRIQSYDVYLKCVGQEDLGRPNIECGAQGCDCLRLQQATAFEGERIQYLDGGRGFNIKAGEATDVPLLMPQKVDKQYRYDHVVVKLNLDRLEDPKKCFDTGYEDGTFYYPLIDISPPAQFVCQADLNTGRYLCPAVMSQFGAGGGSYLEDPFMSCYDKNTQSWIGCDAPNLFVKGDQIRVKNHVRTDSKSVCLRTTITGLGPGFEQLAPQKLPENLPGPFTPELNLGTVSESNFNVGGSSNIILDNAKSDIGCTQPMFERVVEGTLSPLDYAFTYLMQDGNYKVTLPVGANIADASYKIGTGNVLTRNDNTEWFTSEELRGVHFNIQGATVYNLVGSPQLGKNTCTYTVTGAPAQSFQETQYSSPSFAANQRTVTVTTELIQPDISGNCFNANTLVARSTFGQNKHTEYITIQLNPIEAQITAAMHQEFMRNNCAFVLANAKEIISRKKADLEDASSIFYAVACHIMQGQHQWQTTQKNNICPYLTVFFNRQYFNGEKAPPYTEELTSTFEFQKITKYLGIVRDKANCERVSGLNSEIGAGGEVVESDGGTVAGIELPDINLASTTTCGDSRAEFQIPFNHPADWQPNNWNSYVCRTPTPGETTSARDIGRATADNPPQCWARGMYSTQVQATEWGVAFGCPSEQLCCPPS